MRATSRLTSFMDETAALGAELGADRDAIFQALLAATADGGRDFDSQAATDNVPMHQVCPLSLCRVAACISTTYSPTHAPGEGD